MVGATSDKDHPVTISTSAAPNVTIDPQNPLPEPNFLWRRVLAFIVVIAALVLTSFIADSLHDLGAPDALLTLAKWIIGLAALISTYYFVAPSASELTSMIQSAKIIRHSLEVAASADNNSTERRIKADDNATKADIAASQSDSAPSAAPESLEASEAAPADPDADYAPTGRS